MAFRGGNAQWFIADLPNDVATPWDLAHSRIAAELGVDESEVEFAEPDLIHHEFQDDGMVPGGLNRVGANCAQLPQNGSHGQAVGPGQGGWHLGTTFSQLEDARAAVAFAAPRTRIAHLDTGYYGEHVSLPKNLRRDLQRNFVDKDQDPSNAEDPDNDVFLLDNSGHGTGTLGILAGGAIPSLGGLVIGGAPDADIVPLRVADTVLLWRTSAFARALNYAVHAQCDVVSMSMGGVPSQAWKEAVDHAYLDGVCLVTAAGNNFAGVPTRHVVYPARYGRAIAACGVMANGKSYSHLQGITMEGNYGPKKIMKHAMAAYTPNIPWALYGCPDAVRLNGGGTSSATPQIAAAAALWFEKNKALLPRDWRRVEAVRNALFRTAHSTDPERLGHGILRANDALALRPDLTLEQTKGDSSWLGFLRILTGLGLTEPSARERMLNLEVAQRLMLNRELQEIVPDPEIAQLKNLGLERFMEALIEDGQTSQALRKHVVARYPVITGRTTQAQPASERRPRREANARRRAFDRSPAPDTPPYRRLRAYAVDPSYSTQFATAGMNEVTLRVRWEDLERGPKGEYIAVEDVDATGKRYRGVDLNDPRLLASDGWPPSEGNPQFHQQMVYAVAMKTIEHFETALGRPVFWRHRLNPKRPLDDSHFVRRLTIRPHALRQANAFYAQSDQSLAFGYFETDRNDQRGAVPGSRVFTCLSTDIVAHETTHAILDGMHRRFNEPTNPDVLAFHEAFADIVALMQHFTVPEVLEHEIRRTRGDIEAESMLGSLAVQFGRATTGRGALREAIGYLQNGVWQRSLTGPSELKNRLAPHSRGAILVAAVFDAFIAIYKARIADLVRINTAGTGILPTGAIHPDLVKRLVDEATKSAQHVLNMCIRALDYLPPIDVTFFEYLRALITADHDLVADDRHNYRVAFVEAFRRRGIFPNENCEASDLTLSVETLRWRGMTDTLQNPRLWSRIEDEYNALVTQLKKFADDCLYIPDREKLFARTRDERAALNASLKSAFKKLPAFATELGLDPEAATFEVHQLRPATRLGPDGRHIPQVIVGLTQTRVIDKRKPHTVADNLFRGGSTLVIDLTAPKVKYRIVKSIGSASRFNRTKAYIAETAKDPLRALFLSHRAKEPFAVLHALADL
jgi:hypothetical protein